MIKFKKYKKAKQRARLLCFVKTLFLSFKNHRPLLPIGELNSIKLENNILLEEQIIKLDFKNKNKQL